MNPQWEEVLAKKLQGMADDELILGHRDSEWTGHAPILEEDIAFANIAQDEMGHAVVWLELLRQLSGSDPDRLVFFREAAAYRNIQMVELPKGDWAFTMVRQYLFDAWEMVHLGALLESTFQPLRQAAQKVIKEETYHRRHTEAWMRRLGLGTKESHRRTRAALDVLWPYSLQLFQPGDTRERLLVEEGISPETARLEEQWRIQVTGFLNSCELEIPADPTGVPNDRSEHTEHLAPLLADLQQVARLDPQAAW